MRHLIINADDFGLTSGVNQAIIKCESSGPVTSATIMANAEAFPQAANLAKNHPSLRTGCHVVLVDGKPVSRDLPTLTNGTGHFRNSLKDFARAAWRKTIAAEEVQREAESQIRKIQSCGITVTHVDSHKHTHMFPHILGAVLKAAKACGIRAIRNPFEPLRSWPGGLVACTPGLWLRSAAVASLQIFAGQFRQEVQGQGMLTTDGTVGIAATGSLDQRTLLAILRALPEGTWELVCHPAYADQDLKAAGGWLVESRRTELDALTSQDTKSMIQDRGIKLISYADLKV